MEYTEFCKQLKRLVTENEEWNISEEDYTFYPDGFTSETEADLSFIRATNMRYHGIESDVLKGDFIVIETGPMDLRGVCRFSMEFLFGEFQKKGWDTITEMLNENIKIAQKFDANDVLAHIEDYNFIKEHLIIRPLNFPNNRNALYQCIYKQVGDIALVLYLVISRSDEAGLNTTKVRKEMFEQWGQELDDVWNTAFTNTQVSALPRMYINPLDTYKPPYHKGAFMAFNSEIQSLPKACVPCITSTLQTNGAIVMFYPGVKERIAQLYNDSFYAAFTSIHDIRTHSAGSTTPRSVLQNLKHINTHFPKEELLSRKVWFYDKDKKTFEPIEQ